MKKITVLAILLTSLLLAACTAAPSSVQSSPTPNSNEVATEVSLQLTAQAPAPTQLPTATTAPTSTQPEPTAPPTLTPLPLTPTPAEAPTLPADDPRSGLGDPSWKNTMDSGRGFGLGEPYEDDNTRFAVENGALVMTGRKDNGWHGWRLTSPAVENFYLEATMRTRDCSRSDVYGVVVRAPDFDTGRGYYFGLSCDGRFTFGKWVEDGISDIVGLTNHAAINAGSNQTNRIGIRVEGDTFRLYANGKLMDEIKDDSFLTAGNFGVWVAAFETPNFTVEVDEMQYWKLP